MQTIYLRDFGVLPNTDVTLSLYRLFLRYPNDTEFVFENADYFFSPHEELRADYCLSNSDKAPYRALGIWMKGMKNCVLRGCGARLWFSGHVQSFTLDHCENVKILGFTVNWKKPLVAEGVVVDRSDERLNIYVDPEAFPHHYRNGTLEFDVGANEWYPLAGYSIAFEPHARKVRRNTADVFLGEASDLGGSVYGFTLKNPVDVHVGDLLNLRHNRRMHANVFSEKCKNLVVEDVTFYSGGGLGCLAQFCHDLTYRRVHFLTDTSAGRFVSGGRDDGMHITCNSGVVTVSECTFHALMDDPINVHGCCVVSDEVVDEKTLRCQYRHEQACGFRYWAEEGNTVGFIARDTMHGLGQAVVQSYALENENTFLLTFKDPLPEEILALARSGNALALDNLTNTVDFICSKNRFGSCRARGILVSTAGKVRITDNYFESSGSAILLAGDSNYWFESGECQDVEIARNVFTDACLGSYFQFCDGVISICPVIPSPTLDHPFHKNVRITDNIFDCAETPVLYAYSCAGLRFANNRVFKSPSAERTHEGTHYLRLRYCKDAVIEKNEWIGRFASTLPVTMEHCGSVFSDEPCDQN